MYPSDRVEHGRTRIPIRYAVPSGVRYRSTGSFFSPELTTRLYNHVFLNAPSGAFPHTYRESDFESRDTNKPLHDGREKLFEAARPPW